MRNLYQTLADLVQHHYRLNLKKYMSLWNCCFHYHFYNRNHPVASWQRQQPASTGRPRISRIQAFRLEWAFSTTRFENLH